MRARCHLLRLRHKLFQLTWKDHRDHERVCRKVKHALGNRMWLQYVIGWSIVHEPSDKEHPYELTYAAFVLSIAPDVEVRTKFDFCNAGTEARLTS